MAIGSTMGPSTWRHNGYFWSASADGTDAWDRVLVMGYTRSSPEATATDGTVFQFVAFGIKSIGFWDGVDSLTLWF